MERGFTEDLRAATGPRCYAAVAMEPKPRLLIVEDEDAIRSGLEDVFVYHGYAVETATDGREGLRLATTGRFGIVLLDVMLPGLDGFTVCERIRAADRDQPIIMLTARGTDEDVIHGLRLGADDYVTKPFSVAQLVARVAAVLRRTRPGQADGPIRLGADVEIVPLDPAETSGT